MMKNLIYIFFVVVFIVLCNPNFSKAQKDKKHNIEVITTKATKLYSISGHAHMNDVADKLGSDYGELFQFVMSNDIELTGAPLAITNDFQMEEDGSNFHWSYEAGLQVSNNTKKPNGKIKASELPAMKAVRILHIGPYAEMMECYTKIMEYIENNNLEINGRSWEEYIDDPTEVPEENIRTYIYFPVK